MAKPGILYVSVQPKPDLPEAEFHDWYNNEHGPLRIRLPHIFPNGLRYKITDGRKPAYIAMYDVADMQLTETDEYAALRNNRSEREKAVVGQLDITRKFADLVRTWESQDFVPISDLTDAEALGLANVAVVSSVLKEAATDDSSRRRFLEGHIADLSKLPGWLRSRLFYSGDQFLVLHDFSKDSDVEQVGLRAAFDASQVSEALGTPVAVEDFRVDRLFHVIGSAPRDLLSLSQRHESAVFNSGDGTCTEPGPKPVISSSIKTADSLDIQYRLQGNVSPNAPTVAFCNSLLTSLHMWDPLIAILERERPDLRILRYNARGRHQIPQPPVTATLETVTDDLVKLLDALRIPQLHLLIGVSMGGATVLNFALRHPDRLRRFIACDCNISSSAANTQAWKDRAAMAEENDGRGIHKLATQTVSRWFHPSSMANSSKVQWITEMIAANNVEGFTHSCTALWDYDLKPDIKECKVPGLLVVGEEDAKGALVKAMNAFKGFLGKDGTQLQVVPQTGHLPMCEDPLAFWEAIRGFI